MTPEQLGPTPEQMNIRPVEGEVNEVNLHKKSTACHGQFYY